MKKLFDFDIRDEEHLICITQRGEHCISDMEAMFRCITESPNYRQDYDCLVDAREARFLFTDEELQGWSCREEYQRKTLSRKGRTAFVFNSPKETALGFLETNRNHGVRCCSVFSTLEAAYAWLRAKSFSSDLLCR